MSGLVLVEKKENQFDLIATQLQDSHWNGHYTPPHHSWTCHTSGHLAGHAAGQRTDSYGSRLGGGYTARTPLAQLV